MQAAFDLLTMCSLQPRVYYVSALSNNVALVKTLGYVQASFQGTRLLGSCLPCPVFYDSGRRGGVSCETSCRPAKQINQQVQTGLPYRSMYLVSPTRASRFAYACLYFLFNLNDFAVRILSRAMQLGSHRRCPARCPCRQMMLVATANSLTD